MSLFLQGFRGIRPRIRSVDVVPFKGGKPVERIANVRDGRHLDFEPFGFIGDGCSAAAKRWIGLLPYFAVASASR